MSGDFSSTSIDFITNFVADLYQGLLRTINDKSSPVYCPYGVYTIGDSGILFDKDYDVPYSVVYQLVKSNPKLLELTDPSTFNINPVTRELIYRDTYSYILRNTNGLDNVTIDLQPITVGSVILELSEDPATTANSIADHLMDSKIDNYIVTIDQFLQELHKKLDEASR